MTGTATSTLTPTLSFTLTATATASSTGTMTSTVTSVPSVTFTPTPTPILNSYVTIGDSSHFTAIECVRYLGGFLWVTDLVRNNLQEWSVGGILQGAPVSVYGSGPTTSFLSPEGNAIDPTTGNVYVTFPNKHFVAVFDSSGSYLTSFGQAEFLSSVQPVGAVINSSGTTVYVAQRNILLDANSVFVYAIGGTPSSPTFSYQTKLGASIDFNRPANICLDSSENIYVADPGANALFKMNTSGTLLTTFMISGAFGPNDVAVDSVGKVYAPNMSDNLIYVFDSSGVNIDTFGSGIGFTPWSVAWDGLNTLYVGYQNSWMIVGFH